MKDVIIFHLKRYWEGARLPNPSAHVMKGLWARAQKHDLWEEIKTGVKTSEFRDLTQFWIKRLCWAAWKPNMFTPQNLTRYLKVHKAWFVIGYPKGNLPRLEADITGLVSDDVPMQLWHSTRNLKRLMLEIKFANVKEVSA